MLPTIRLKSTSDYVKVAKYLMGYSISDMATAVFDNSFLDHVMAWQRSHKLVDDGIIGPNTWTALAGQAPLCTTAKTANPGMYSRFSC